MSGASEASESVLASLCPYCQTPVGSGCNDVCCPVCGILHHADCWQENAGCGVYGCSEAPDIESRRPVETPIAYWGQEHKLCPKCGGSIMATALRCRHCGAMFDVAQPQSADDVRRREAARSQGPSLRRGAVWLFVLCVVPLSAPLGVVFGLVWYPRRRDVLASQPALYTALCRLGLGIGVTQTLFAVVMSLLFTLFRSV